ncbi:hypothetical protein SAMN05216327_101222 [Dyadobacter sp. SG02]|nr:hypothetical protein SAMN05216327_101222 [Dyadobacter sp. SG02]
MATLTRVFTCGHCGQGQVKLIAKSTRKSVTMDVGNCSSCRASYGLKGLGGLTEITTKPADRRPTKQVAA